MAVRFSPLLPVLISIASSPTCDRREPEQVTGAQPGMGSQVDGVSDLRRGVLFQVLDVGVRQMISERSLE